MGRPPIISAHHKICIICEGAEDFGYLERLLKNYDAHERQIREICTKIYKRTYPEMKERISKINHSDTVSGSTNFIKFINRFESANTKWIKEINENICT